MNLLGVYRIRRRFGGFIQIGHWTFWFNHFPVKLRSSNLSKILATLSVVSFKTRPPDSLRRVKVFFYRNERAPKRVGASSCVSFGRDTESVPRGPFHPSARTLALFMPPGRSS